PPRDTPARALDERETVERTARAGGLLSPAFREEVRGHTELQLLMDAAPAMRVWQRMLGELAEVFGRLGAFRDLQVHYLHASPDGAPAVSRRFDPAEAPLRPARQLQDPTGRRLTVVVSDCTGPLWRAGTAHRLLHRLATHAPVAVVQPLPGRLWPRTRLPALHGTLHREEGPAGSARLRFVAEAGGHGQRPAYPGAVAVPVLPPTPAALGAWAGLLSGAGPSAVPAAIGWVRPDHPPAPVRRPNGPPRTSAALISRFRSTASPVAGQLAVYLAAAPLFLPVMQLIQRTMLPGSGPAELSEVLLSGLLRRQNGSGGDGRWYEFTDGVHDELLRELGQDEALLVLKHCSSYVEQRFGKTGPNFPALALAQLSGEGEPSSFPAVPEDDERRLPQPFAEVAAKVLRRFLREAPPPPTGPGGPLAPPPSVTVAQARALAGQFAADGKVQHQLEAVRLLRGATGSQRAAGQGSDPELWSELAEQLLALWRVQRDGELLAEALTAASAAAAHPGSLSARAALARVRAAEAGERRAAGDTRGALELWRLADREFHAVSSTPGLDHRLAVDLTLERTQVLEEQWRLTGDTHRLQESIGTLEAVTEAWPTEEPQPSTLPLAHGRALLRLAAAADDAEQADVYAGQAAELLRQGCWTLEAENAPSARRVRALLDLVDALLLTESEWLWGEEVVAQAIRLADERGLKAACHVRAGRLSVRTYEADERPADLEEAARRFEEAARLGTRDRADYSDLIEEWGAALLRRADRPDGGPFISRAVRVLRDCRMETPAGDPRLPGRLLLLGRALIARYQEDVDLVDLREAEHLFSRAARDATTPLTEARAWFELGETHRRAYRHIRRPERLNQAAEAYTRTARAARAAENGPGDTREPVRLAATAFHQRGTVLEAARRPLAAGEAYRAAQRLWQLTDDDTAAQATTARLNALQRDR
uniref:SAV_2336 N-terminal domain-related protein n=1 Tax=Streptomyces sp. SBT349 TaxID=1580539 RepID=UPI00066E9132